MIEKTVNLNLDLNAPPAILHVTQGDTAWEWHFRLFMDGSRWTIPTGAQIIFKGLKPDGHVFAFSGSVASNEAIVTSDLQMTICAGEVPCSLIILDANAKRLAFGRITMYVAADAEGQFDVASESALPAFVELLEQYAQIIDEAATIPDDLPGYITDNVDAWLVAHPEATTTVQDGSVTKAKLAAALVAELTPDATLTASGKPADAKATGDKIDNLKSAFADLTDDVTTREDNHISPNWSSVAASNSSYGSFEVNSDNGTITLTTGSANKNLMIPFTTVIGRTYSVSFKITSASPTAEICRYSNVYPPAEDKLTDLTYNDGIFAGTFTANNTATSIVIKAPYTISGFTISEIEIIDEAIDNHYYLKTSAIAKASTSEFGVMKVGEGLNVNNGVLSNPMRSELSELEDFVIYTVPNPNKAVFSNDNFNGAKTSLTFENDGFVYTHGSSNDQNWFKWEGLEIGTEYTLKFKVGNATTSSGTKIFVSSLVDEIYSEGYAISSIISAPIAGDYTLTFTPTLQKVGFMFRVGYIVSTFTITDVSCKKSTDVHYLNTENLQPIPLQKIDYDSTDNPTLYMGREFVAFDKCLCIGDSLTEGVFNHNEGGTLAFATITKYSYPTLLTKLFGVPTTNKGTGGATAAQWYALHSSDDLSGHDVCVIALGANDALQSVSKADTKTALANIITKVKADNSKIKIFLCTLLPAYYTNDSAHNATNDAIKETVDATSDCYLIDLTQYSECKKNTKYSQGHLTAIGYMREAIEIVSAASYIIRTSSINEFRYIQFINTNYSYT